MRIERISDPYIKVERNLEGFDSNRSYWTSSLLSTEPTEKQWRIIESYKFRVRELNENIVDLRLPQIHQTSIRRTANGAHVHAHGIPQKHRAKSLFLDFRHFLSDKEPSKFELVCNTIQELVATDSCNSFLRNMRKDWLKCSWQDGDFIDASVTAKTLFRVWFNTQYFHSGRDSQIEEKKQILERYDEETIRNLLVMSIVETRKYLVWVYCIVKDMDRNSENRYFLPDDKQIRADEKELYR